MTLVLETQPRLGRGEAAVLRYTVEGTDNYSFVSSPPGSLNDRGGGELIWTSGFGEFGEDDTVPWPWTTGPVTITARAFGADCESRAAVELVLDGDVLVAQRQAGNVIVYATNGRTLGTMGLINDGQVGGLIGRADGTFFGTFNGAPGGIVRLNDRLQIEVTFDSDSLVGEALWAEGDGPDNVLWHAAEERIFADGGMGAVYSFDDAGSFVEAIALPADDRGEKILAMSQLQNGDLLVGLQQDDRILAYDFAQRAWRIWARHSGSEMVSLTAGHDDLIVAFATDGNRAFLSAFDQQGAQVHEAWEDFTSDLDWCVPFRQGTYLCTSAGYSIRYVNADLDFPEGVAWQETPEGSAAAGLVWLDFP